MFVILKLLCWWTSCFTCRVCFCQTCSLLLWDFLPLYGVYVPAREGKGSNTNQMFLVKQCGEATTTEKHIEYLNKWLNKLSVHKYNTKSPWLSGCSNLNNMESASDWRLGIGGSGQVLVQSGSYMSPGSLWCDGHQSGACNHTPRFEYAIEHKEKFYNSVSAAAVTELLHQPIKNAASAKAIWLSWLLAEMPYHSSYSAFCLTSKA